MSSKMNIYQKGGLPSRGRKRRRCQSSRRRVATQFCRWKLSSAQTTALCGL